MHDHLNALLAGLEEALRERGIECYLNLIDDISTLTVYDNVLVFALHNRMAVSNGRDLRYLDYDDPGLVEQLAAVSAALRGQ